ncbi:MAG TPA: HTH domain-containing protein [Gammaproteobacteria bacterium]|nr:HTH domain-containing protein [Gammaproteobacteria bacterium]
MFYGFGPRQQQLLQTLLENKSGLTVDELSKSLGITRTAVNQHLLALESSGYLTKGKLTKTGGRPGHTYVLTQQGYDLFPKQYAWFSQLLLDFLQKQLGDEGVEKYMSRLGLELAKTVKERIKGATPEERVVEVAAIMQELGYDAYAEQTENNISGIKAYNCVYHHLAQSHREVCQLDISLLSSLLSAEIKHTNCMAKGDSCCQFQVVHFRKK